MGVGGALLFGESAAIGALMALVLLMAFSAAGALALARRRSVDCGCFGAIHRAPIGTATLTRNALLAALAAGIALDGAGNPWSVAVVVVLGAMLVVSAVAWRVTVRSSGSGEMGSDSGEIPEPARLTRRGALRMVAGTTLGGSLLWLLGGLAPTGAAARPILRPCCYDCTCFDPACCGLVGGGLVETASGRGQLAAFGTKLAIAGRKPAPVGSLTWTDAEHGKAGLRLVAVRIDDYGRVPGASVRELRGVVRTGSGRRHRFVLRVTASGTPVSSSSDIVDLRVIGLSPGGAGDSGSDYHVRGRLASGDITTRLTVGRPR